MIVIPCEYIVWNGLPIIRRGIALSMINDFGLKQKDAAEKLGITPAAVSQYISGKRGKFDINDNDLYKEINISAERIIENGEEMLTLETCRLCKIFISKKIFPINEQENNCNNVNK